MILKWYYDKWVALLFRVTCNHFSFKQSQTNTISLWNIINISKNGNKPVVHPGDETKKDILLIQIPISAAWSLGSHTHFLVSGPFYLVIVIIKQIWGQIILTSTTIKIPITCPITSYLLSVLSNLSAIKLSITCPFNLYEILF